MSDETRTVLSRTQTILADALALDSPDDAKADASLVRDLGAESIDLLDIAFRIEKEFGIAAPRRELFPEDVFNRNEFVVDGLLTAAGLAKMQEVMPHLDLGHGHFSEFVKLPRLLDMGTYLTVGDLVQYVEHKLSDDPPGENER